MFWSPSKIQRAFELQDAEDQAIKDKEAATKQKKKKRTLKTPSALLLKEQKALERANKKVEQQENDRTAA